MLSVVPDATGYLPNPHQLLAQIAELLADAASANHVSS
jgi:hypothetical protein